MSGGRFDYADSHAKTEIFGFSDEPHNVFEDIEISKLVWDVFDLIHEFDWYASGDTDKSDWLEAKRNFKSKWFGNRDERTKSIIDETVEAARTELYETFGVGINDPPEGGA